MVVLKSGTLAETTKETKLSNNRILLVVENLHDVTYKRNDRDSGTMLHIYIYICIQGDAGILSSTVGRSGAFTAVSITTGCPFKRARFKGLRVHEAPSKGFGVDVRSCRSYGINSSMDGPGAHGGYREHSVHRHYGAGSALLAV